MPLLHLFFFNSKCLSKVALALIPLLLLPYSANTQALSAHIAQVINGTNPYLTFDNGRTKVTTTEGLLGITLSDGTSITPTTNTSTSTNPIKLPKDGQSFADIGMLIPTTTDSITLNDLIGAPNNYWGDDDGDGKGVNGITATGSLSVSITDKNNQAVSRSTVLNICNAPYKVVLSSTNGSLNTQYGLPNSSNFTGSSATYYIKPNSPPSICYVRPSLQFGTNGGEISRWNFTGPANIWNLSMGFLVQSTQPSSYSRNFPTTGANNLYFDLLIGGNGPLTWPAVTKGGITATMTLNPPRDNFNPNGDASVRVTLTGPSASEPQINSNSPSRLGAITLPQTFELVGYDSSNRAVVKYGFVLKKWFVNSGNKIDTAASMSSWCSSLGYRMSNVKDLTNAVCLGVNSAAWCQGSVGATPSSSTNNYMRYIGAGFFAEWGRIDNYTGAGFVAFNYWTSDNFGTKQFYVYSNYGYVNSFDSTHNSERPEYYGVCTYP